MTTSERYDGPTTAGTQYDRVTATEDEVAAYKARNNGLRPSSYRVACVACGKRIWGSGLARGSHYRWHKRNR